MDRTDRSSNISLEFEGSFNNSDSFRRNAENKIRSNEYHYDFYYMYNESFTTYWDYIICIMSFIAAIFNIVTIVVLGLLKRPLKTQMKFLLSLSISDSFIALLQFLQYFYSFWTIWNQRIADDIDIALIFKCSLKSFDLNTSSYLFYVQFIFKQALQSVYVTAQLAGLGTVMFLSIDVLIKVWKPLRYNILMSKRRGNIMAVCIWLVSCAIVIVIFGTLCKDEKIGFSLIIWWISTSFLLLYWPFFIFFIIIYIIILCLIKSFLKQRPSGQLSSNKKAVVTIFIILITYFVSALPGFQVMFVSTVNGLLGLLYTLNLICDPIIYAFRIPEIRVKYVEIWSMFSTTNTASN